jgi:hypothetical protein
MKRSAPGIIALKKVAQIAGENRRLRSRLPARATLERRRPFGNGRRILHLLLAENLAAAMPIAQNLDAAKSRTAEN